jgi:creatinine amidohydrolase/Fe(II)-dependent formamide hydrolase-like protein
MTPTPHGIRAENLTWPEVQEALKSLHTVLIPVGAGCKEHGLLLPLNTDLLSANYLTDRVRREIVQHLDAGN